MSDYTRDELLRRRRLKESLAVLEYAMRDVQQVVHEMIDSPEFGSTAHEHLMDAVSGYGKVRTNISAIIPDDLDKQIFALLKPKTK